MWLDTIVQVVVKIAAYIMAFGCIGFIVWKFLKELHSILFKSKKENE